MIVVSVMRKPIRGAIVSAVESSGAGGIAIDACRIGIAPDDGGNFRVNKGQSNGCQWGTQGQSGKPAISEKNVLGRWPANLILAHSLTCRCVGAKAEPGYVINRWADGAKPFGGGAGHKFESEAIPGGKSLVWECREGCPVNAMDKQTGLLPCRGNRNSSVHEIRSPTSSFKEGCFRDSGEAANKDPVGTVAFASRCFKQVGPASVAGPKPIDSGESSAML